MKILALDLGTNTGYCTNRSGVTLECGTWKLATDKEVTAWGKTRLTRRGDPRVCRLLDNIAKLGLHDVIVFEDVQFSSTTYQTQLWAAFRSVIWLAACQDCGTIIEAVPVSTLKKFATGNGAADKPAMRHALQSILIPSNFDPAWDDNAIDAHWLYVWAQRNLGRTRTIKP